MLRSVATTDFTPCRLRRSWISRRTFGLSFTLFLLRKVFVRTPHDRACIKMTHPYPDGNIVYSNAKENKDASKEGSRVVFRVQ